MICFLVGARGNVIAVDAHAINEASERAIADLMRMYTWVGSASAAAALAHARSKPLLPKPL